MHKERTLTKAEQEMMLKKFRSAMDTAQRRFDFTIHEIAALIGLQPRTLFRILAESRPVEHSDLLQMQTVALTLLKLEWKALNNPNFDLRKVKA